VAQLLYLLVDCVVREFNKEHLLLLINEFLDVLGPNLLLSWELDPTLSYVHSTWNVTALVAVEVVNIVLHLGWWDISVLQPPKGHARGGSLLVPNFKVFRSLLSFLALLLLSLSSDKDLLVVKLSERWWTTERLLWLSTAILLWSHSLVCGRCVPLARWGFGIAASSCTIVHLG
jgi:hypothetical protein